MIVLEFIVETIDEIRDELDLLDDYDAGRICGLIAGEIATDVILGAASGGVALAAKSTSMQRVLTRLDDIPGIPPTAFDDLAAISARIARIGAMCAAQAASRPEGDDVTTLRNSAAKAACEKCSADYLRRLAQTPNLRPYAAMEQTVRTLDVPSNLARPGLAEFIHNVMRDDLYNFPNGTVVLGDLPTVRTLKTLFGGRGLGQDLHVHHIVEQRFLEPVFEIADEDSVPGVALFLKEHANYGGQNKFAITTLLRNRYAYGINYTQLSRPDVIAAHAAVYRRPQVNWPGMADALEAWAVSLEAP